MVTDSDNRIRLAPVSECVHSTALVGDGFPHFIARGFCIRRWRVCCRRRPPPAYNSTGDVRAVNEAAHGLTLRTSQA
jgi:hypothetical protein